MPGNASNEHRTQWVSRSMDELVILNKHSSLPYRLAIDFIEEVHFFLELPATFGSTTSLEAAVKRAVFELTYPKL